MIKVLLIATLVACVNNGAGNAGSPPGDQACNNNDCVCAPDVTCTEDCSAGSECQVQATGGDSVDVTCTATDACMVECSGAASCTVDCAGRADCQVTCPAAHCTVTNIPAGDPNVLCGDIATPSRSGTTATCP